MEECASPSPKQISDINISYEEPEHCSLYLTRRCNMKCPHCLLRLYDQDCFKNEDIDLSQAKAILTYFYQKGLRSLTIGALGEVFLNPDFRDIVKSAREIGFNVIRTVTNGILVHQYLDCLVDYFDFINISLDGYDNQTYAKHRGVDGLYDKIIKNIKALLRAKESSSSKLHVSLVHVIYEENLYDMEKMIRLAETLKVDRIVFKNFHPVDNDHQECTSLRNDNKEVIEYFSSIMASKKYTVQIVFPSLLGRTNKTFLCSNLFNDIIVGPKGLFSPCCQIPIDKQYGNFSVEPDAYKKNAILQFKESFLRAKQLPDLSTICRQCQALNIENYIFFPDTQEWKKRVLTDNYRFSFAEKMISPASSKQQYFELFYNGPLPDFAWMSDEISVVPADNRLKPEEWHGTEKTLRWSRPEFQLPFFLKEEKQYLEIHWASMRPEVKVMITLSTLETEFSIEILITDPEWRKEKVSLPRKLKGPVWAIFEINPPFFAPSDSRELGLAIKTIRFLTI